MFALFPAAVITIYCELRVKPYMEAFYARQKESQQRRGYQQQPQTKNAMRVDRAVEESVETQHKMSLSERLNSFWTEVHALVVEGVPTGEGENKDDSSEKDGAKDSAKDISSSHKDKPTKDPTTKSSNAEVPTESSPSSPTTSIEPVTLEVLAQRLERLESLIRTKVTTEDTSDTLVDEEEPLVNQSGIKSRIEQRMREAAEADSMHESSQEKAKDENNFNWGQHIWNSMANLLKDDKGNEDKAPKRDETADNRKPPPKETEHESTYNKETDAEPPNSKAEIDSNAPSNSDEQAGNKSERPWWKIW